MGKVIVTMQYHSPSADAAASSMGGLGVIGDAATLNKRPHNDATAVSDPENIAKKNETDPEASSTGEVGAGGGAEEAKELEEKKVDEENNEHEGGNGKDIVAESLSKDSSGNATPPKVNNLSSTTASITSNPVQLRIILREISSMVSTSDIGAGVKSFQLITRIIDKTTVSVFETLDNAIVEGLGKK